MSREEFITKLQSIIDLGDNCKALVYFALKSADGGINVKKANIQLSVLDLIAIGYKETLAAEIEKFNADAERSILNLSDRDDRANVVYRYDLPDDEPSYFDKMREVVAAHPVDYYTGEHMFSFDADSLSQIDYFIVEIGAEDNKIVVYRNNFNVNLMKQARGRFYVTRSGTQLCEVDNDILRMDSQIDMMKIDDDFFILNLSYLDSSKEFASIIKTRAETALSGIEGLNIVDTVEGLRERLVEVSFARRLMRAMDASPVTGMPAEKVIEFVGGHDKLRKVLKIVDSKITMPTKKSQDMFVRLLNDDFLHSLLTQQDYESTSKNKFN